jgi:hypothetical protein
MLNTTVYLETAEGTKLDSAKTDGSGAYSFSKVANGTYKLICTTTLSWGGANPIDALLINKHYIGSVKITEPLRLRAADVTGDGKINPSDALAVLRRFITIIPTFLVQDWLYDNPVITVNNADVIQDIKANCAGDVNGSYPTKYKAELDAPAY